MSVESDVSVEVHQSEEELILYLSREMDMGYAEAKEYYEQQATVVA
jgi:hypothetical protein